MELDDMWYRIERDGETLKGFYATFYDGHTERWDEQGERIKDRIMAWGFQPDLSGPTAGELAAQGDLYETKDLISTTRV